MSDSMKIPDIQANLNITVSGQDQIDQLERRIQSIESEFVDISNAINTLFSGSGMEKYYSSVEDAVDRVMRAYDKFNSMSYSDKAASELIKSLNALEALSGKSASEVISGYDRMIDKVQQAQKIFESTDLGKVGAFSVDRFREFFTALDTAQSYGLDLSKLFASINLNNELASQLKEMENLLHRTREEAAELRIALAESGGDMTIIDRFRNIVAAEQELFSNFLSTSNISQDQLEAQSFFERITEGSMTASQAIKEFKLNYSHLLDPNVSGGSQSPDEYLSGLAQKIEDIHNIIASTNNTNSLGQDAIAPLTNLDDILNKIYEVLVQISTVIGGIDPNQIDWSGFETIDQKISTVAESLAYLRTAIDGLNGTSINVNQNIGITQAADTMDQGLELMKEKASVATLALEKAFEHIGAAADTYGKRFTEAVKGINIYEILGKMGNAFSRLTTQISEASTRGEAQTVLSRINAYANQLLDIYARLENAGIQIPKIDLSAVDAVQAKIDEFDAANREAGQTTLDSFAKAINAGTTLLPVLESIESHLQKIAESLELVNSKMIDVNRFSPLENILSGLESKISSIADKIAQAFGGISIGGSGVSVDGLDAAVNKTDNLQTSAETIATNINAAFSEAFDLTKYNTAIQDFANNIATTIINSLQNLNGLSINSLAVDQATKTMLRNDISASINMAPFDINVALNPSSAQTIVDEIQQAIDKGNYTLTFNGSGQNPPPNNPGGGGNDAEGSQLYKLYSDIYMNAEKAISELERMGNVDVSQLRNNLETIRNSFLGMVGAAQSSDVTFNPISNDFLVMGHNVQVAKDSVDALTGAFQRWSLMLKANQSESQGDKSTADLIRGFLRLDDQINKTEAKYREVIQTNTQVGQSFQNLATAITTAMTVDASGNLQGTKQDLADIQLQLQLFKTQAAQAVPSMQADDSGIQNMMSKLSDLIAKLHELQQQSNDSELNTLGQRIAAIVNQFGLIQNGKFVDPSTISMTNEQLQEVLGTIKQIGDAMAVVKNQIKSENGDFKNNTAWTNFDTSNLARIEELQNVLAIFPQIQAAITAFRTNFEAAMNGTGGLLNSGFQSLEEVKNAWAQIEAMIAGGQKVEASNLWKGFDDLSNKAQDLMSSMPLFKSELQDIIDKAKEFRNSLENASDADRAKVVEDATKGFKDLSDKVEEAQNHVGFFGKAWDGVLGRMLSPYVITRGLRKIIQSYKEMIETVKELDKSVTDLQIATGATKDETRLLLQEYSKMASELGSTTADVASAADTWLRQGYSKEQADQLIKASMVLSKLGQIESSEAATALTATMNSYGIAVEDVMSIVDKFTKVDMEAAASAGGIAKSLSETATSAKVAGVDLDRLIGYITTITEVTQDAPESVGTFMKTMFGRMGNIKAGKLSDPETGDDLSNVEAALRGMGIALRESNGEFRDFGSVLDEISSKWGNLSEAQKRAAAVAVGSTRNQEKFFVLMEHYNEAMQYMDTSLNSAGTAMEKYNSSYLTSIEAAQNKLKASKESLSLSMFNADSLSGFYSALSSITNAYAKLKSSTGGFITTAMNMASVMILLTSKSEVLSKAVTGMKASFNNVALGMKKLTKATAGMDAATASAVKHVRAGLAAIAISAGISIISAVVEHYRKLREEAATAAEELENTTKSANEYKESFISIRNELADGNLSEDQQLTKKKELLDIEQKLIEIFGSEAKGLNLVTGAIKEQTDAIDNLVDAADDEWVALHRKGIASSTRKLDGFANIFMAEGHVGTDIRRDVDQSRRDEFYSAFQSELNDIALLSDIGDNIGLKGSALKDVYAMEDAWKRIYDFAVEYSDVLTPDSLDKLSARYAYFNKLITENGATVEKYATIVLNGDNGSISKFWQQAMADQANIAASLESGNLEEAAAKILDLQNIIKKIQNTSQYKDDEALRMYVDNYFRDFFDGYEYDAVVTIAYQFNTKRDKKNEYEDVQNSLDVFTKGGIFQESRFINVSKAASDATDEEKAALEGIQAAAEQAHLSVGDYIERLKELGFITSDVKDKNEGLAAATLSYKGILDSMSAVSDVGDKLQKLMTNMKKNNYAGFSDIMAVIDKMNKLELDGLNTEKWSKELFAASGSYSEMQSVISDLTNEIIDLTIVKNGWSEANKDELASMLREWGVANAETVATKKLAGVTKEAAKAARQYASIDSVAAINKKIKSLENEAKACGVTKQAFADLVAAEIIFNNTSLDVSDKIEALERLAVAAGAASGAFTNTYNQLVFASRQHGRTHAEQEAAEQAAMNEAFSYVAGGGKENTDIDITIPGDDKGSGGGGDKYLEGWKQRKKVLENQLERDEITKTKYYEELAKLLAELEQKNAGNYDDEIAETQTDIYNHQKEIVEDYIAEKQAQLENDKAKGIIDEKEYQRQMGEITEKGYKDLLRMIEEENLYGVDTQERLEAENELLGKIHDAHVAEYEAEKKDLDDRLDYGIITEEQYYTELLALYAKYYEGQKEYNEEAKEAEKELYEYRVKLMNKWANVASKAVSGISTAAADIFDALEQLVNGLVEANKANFELSKSELSHQLALNYITEAEYMEKLAKLREKYYDSARYTNLEEIWEIDEELYDYEVSKMEEAASSIESIHSKIVDMIKHELDEAKKAIDDTKEKYLDLLEIRRKALDDEKDKDDYEKQRNEMLAEIAEIQRQMNAISNDTSNAGQAKYLQLASDLAEKQKDLRELEEDRAYDLAKKQIDDEQDAYEKYAKEQTKLLEDNADNNEWLVEEAWRRIANQSDELYQALIDDNKQYTTSIKDDVTGAWEGAFDAASKYMELIKQGYTSEQAYARIQDMLAHPENYDNIYINADIAATDAGFIDQKQMYNTVDVMQEFYGALTSIYGDAASNIVDILDEAFPNLFGASEVDNAFVEALTSVGNAYTGISSSTLGILSTLGGLDALGDMVDQTLHGGKPIAITSDLLESVFGSVGDWNQIVADIFGAAGLDGSLTGTNISSILTITNQILEMLGVMNGTNDATGITGILSSVMMTPALITGLTNIFNAFMENSGLSSSSMYEVIQSMWGIVSSAFGVNGEVINHENWIATILNAISSLLTRLSDVTVGMSGKIDAENTWLLKLVDGINSVILWSVKQVDGLSAQSDNLKVVADSIGSIARSVLALFTGKGYASGTSNVSRTGIYRTDEVGGEAKFLRGASGNYTLLTKGSKVLNAEMTNRLMDAMNDPAAFIKKFSGVKLDGVNSAVMPIIDSSSNNVTMNNTFEIKSSDPQGVAAEIRSMLPEIASYTAGAMVGGLNNKGVRRKAASLV